MARRPRHRCLYPGERKSQWADGSLWHRAVHLHARGEQLSLPGRQSPEVRRNQCAQPHTRLLFDGEALSRVLAKEPLHARQVSDPCHPHLRVGAAAGPRPGPDTRVRDLATGAAKSGSTVRRAKELHRTLRRMRFVREQFYLAATAQNLKRLVRFLSCKPTPQIATA